MPSNSLLYFITNIIKFEGFKAKNYHFITDDELLIELENKENLAICPHCNKQTDKIHQSHRYRVRDIPISSYDVFLLVNRRQFRCKNCRKVFSEELSFVKKRRILHSVQLIPHLIYSLLNLLSLPQKLYNLSKLGLF